MLRRSFRSRLAQRNRPLTRHPSDNTTRLYIFVFLRKDTMARLAFLGAACLLSAPAHGLGIQSHSHGLWPWSHRPAKPARKEAAPKAEEQPAAQLQEQVAAAPVQLQQSSGSAAAQLNRSSEAKKEAVVVDEAGNRMLHRWVKTGPAEAQEVKSLFQNDTWVQEKLHKSCGKGNTTCAVVEVDKMLCEALELAGFEGWISGSLTQLEGILNATMNRSSKQFGVDTAFRSALFRFARDTSWPASSRDDGSAFPRLVTKALASAQIKGLVNQTCSGIEYDEERLACRKHAPRALFCQALTQTAARMKDSDELVPKLVQATKLRGDAEEIILSALYKGLPNVTKNILNMSMELSFDQWLRSGADADRTLRAKCIMGHAMKQYVEKKCADPLSDCGMQVYDSMICGALQRLGDTVATPDIEKGLYHAIDSDQINYDLITRRAFAAKFKAQPNHTRGPELDKMKDNADYQLAQMKKRLLANSTFQKLVSRTCVPLNRIRPSCWETTPTFLFCQALSTSASQLLGGAGVFKLMQSQKAMVPN
ncbi:unnamed protein product [Prorocentrum cordatum]|uniref:Uncharacterized protein n=1 Tax=Prorocentrum cordatum TaxID=2364126 RepID=A0ABN9WGY8_9DINO|nr:unnamed protein product [Polarella glacialis]CAK0884504.1 unnamed protein product [Polarella glacialis]